MKFHSIPACVTILTLAFVARGAEKPDSENVLRQYRRQQFHIPMRDGVRLFTVVYTPRTTSGPRPILFNRTPYGAFGHGRKFVGPSEFIMRDSDIVADQDVPGRGRSEGALKGTGSWSRVPGSPLVDRNPQIFCDINRAEDSDFRKAAIRIEHSWAHPSSIDLMVLR